MPSVRLYEPSIQSKTASFASADFVTGSSDNARSKDLPLAEWLRDEIDRRGGGLAYRRAVIVRDEHYVRAPAFHAHPTISIGGPGTNDVAQHLSQILPLVIPKEDKSFVQMHLDLRGYQIALWGMDAESTRSAVEAFVSEGLVDSLLTRIWPFRPTAVC